MRIIRPGYKYEEPSIGRVLTIESARGAGLGREAMRFALELINQEFGQVGVRISAQAYLEKFYQGLGFQAVSEKYDEEGIDHIEMLKSPNY